MPLPVPLDLMSVVATHLRVMIAALRLLTTLLQQADAAPPGGPSPSVRFSRFFRSSLPPRSLSETEKTCVCVPDLLIDIPADYITPSISLKLKH